MVDGSASVAVRDPEASRTRRRAAAVVRPDACVACGACVDACPRGAIELDDVATIDDRLCTGCGLCVEACAEGALEVEAA